MGKIIDGKKIAQKIRKNLKTQVEKFDNEGRKPGLSVVLVGDNPASQTYVNMKEKDAQEIGIYSDMHHLDSDTSQKELIELVQSLNENDKIDGILVQLPLPDHINSTEVIDSINPAKDVDGFHPVNTGRLFNGQEDKLRFEPCTPIGIMELLVRHIDIDGKNAVIVGRSNIVGKPVAHLLLAEHATITICHSHTKSLKEETLRADILIAAAGSPELITGDMVKEGATVIDVGINRVDGELVGDVEFDKAKKKAKYITPVPGGVGPMTRAMLMKNVIKARKNHGI